MTLTRAQIVSGFNKYHKNALEDIIEHYGGISVSRNVKNRATTSFVTGPDGPENPAALASIYSIKLTGLELNDLSISFKHSALEVDITKPIAFDYPKHLINDATGKGECQNWEDVKEVLIHMSKVAAIARGYSHIVLRGVDYPTEPLTLLLIFLIFLVIFGHYNTDLLYDSIFANYYPLSYLLFLKPYHSYIMYGAFAIHIFEIWKFLLPRLKKYRVSTDYVVEWYLFALLDGYPTVKRFDNRVNRFQDDDKYWRL